MGTVRSGTITLDISGAENADWTDEDGAADSIAQDVAGVIAGACETYRDSVSVNEVIIHDFEPGVMVASVELTARATVTIAYSPDEVDVQSWAQENAHLILWESGDTEWDASVEDSDTGEQSSDFDADDGDLDDPVQMAQRSATMYREQADSQRREKRRYRDIIDRFQRLNTDIGGREMARNLVGYLDVEAAHDMALAENATR